ncbi:MAG: F0F1 ATP synthase subunit beta, partial [Desulfobacterales bacterium]|nr:F0F1 ATP synthase subunit beta [Desulfobacterales bacterium]
MSKPEVIQTASQGTVVSVRGSVVDAHFPERLPFVNSLLRAGEDGTTAIEVQTHLNAEVVRGVSLTPTQGLARGSLV